MLFKAGADCFMRQYFCALNLCQALLDFPQKPVIIINCPLDCLKCQGFCSESGTRRRQWRPDASRAGTLVRGVTRSRATPWLGIEAV